MVGRLCQLELQLLHMEKPFDIIVDGGLMAKVLFLKVVAFR